MSTGPRPVTYVTATTDPDGAETVRRVEVYPDGAGLWRYRVKALNGQVVGGPQQGYARKDGALRAAHREHPERPRTP